MNALPLISHSLGCQTVEASLHLPWLTVPSLPWVASQGPAFLICASSATESLPWVYLFRELCTLIHVWSQGSLAMDSTSSLQCLACTPSSNTGVQRASKLGEYMPWLPERASKRATRPRKLFPLFNG